MRAEPGVLIVGRLAIELIARAEPLTIVARTGTLGW
jgi:hypothetical protein